MLGGDVPLVVQLRFEMFQIFMINGDEDIQNVSGGYKTGGSNPRVLTHRTSSSWLKYMTKTP